MNDESKLEEESFQYSLPEIQIVDPKTGNNLMIATPQPGKFFDLKIPQDITADQLLVTLRELVTFHYRNMIAVQRALMRAGVSAEQVGALFFPDVPKESEKLL